VFCRAAKGSDERKGRPPRGLALTGTVEVAEPHKCSLWYSAPVRNLTFSLGFSRELFSIVLHDYLQPQREFPKNPKAVTQGAKLCFKERETSERRRSLVGWLRRLETPTISKIVAMRWASSAVLSLTVVLVTSDCSDTRADRARIEPVYDQQTGRLQLLRYDSDGDGKIDTWSYMDGTRVLRIEIDKDEDGKLDRWEYYGPDQKIEKVGSSRANDGKVDTWSYPGPDGSIARVEVSTRHDGEMNRTEYYEKGVLVRAEEDSDGDGKPDKWESYDGGRMASVAFDTSHRGTPDRRLVYGSQGTARVEIDSSGDGHFVAVREPEPAHRK